MPAQYAKALRDEVLQGKVDAAALLQNFRQALQARGHEKLLPSIYNEYQKLELADERSKKRSAITPESEQTRNLLELYRRLVTAN